MSVSSSYASMASSSAPNAVMPAKPQTRPIYDPERDTFKQSLYTYIVSNIFSSMKPTESTYMYGLLKTIYIDTPLRFNLVCGIHQNHETDPLHFSVEVTLEGVKMAFHVNGYYKSPKFIVTHLTVRDNQQTIKFASFTNTTKTWQDFQSE